MTFTNLLPWFSILGIGILLFFQWKQRQNIRGTDVSILQKELAEKSKELTEVKKELEKEKEGKSTLSGQNKELYAQVTNLKAEKNSLIKENEKLQTQVTKTEAGREQKEKEYSQALQKLDEAKKSLEEERKRVIREDEERKKQELEERDRMWNEHEHVVVSQLTDLCAKPQLKFTTYDNTNLPDDFDGSIKPDFLIDFLGQYIIFDAKISRSDNFQNYIKTQVQSTVKKVKNNHKIASTIFLVVPTEAISLLKKTDYYEGGYTVYVISPESLPPILASLKKITTYELADQFDPEERESIINWIAKLDFHISTRNTFDIMLAEMGAELLSDSQTQNPELSKEIDQRKEKMRAPTIRPSEMKRLLSSVLARKEKIEELTSPVAQIEKRDLPFKTQS